MFKFNTIQIFIALIVSGFALTAMAEDSVPATTENVIKVCSGPVGLSYDTFVKKKLPTIRDISYEYIETQGGGENLAKLRAGDCDVGIITEPMVPNDGSVIAIAPIFWSYGILVCNKERTEGATSLSDLVDLKRKPVIAIGGQLSTSAFVFQHLGELEPNFKIIYNNPQKSAFVTIFVGMTKALPQVISGAYDCAFTASGLSFSFAKALDFAKSAKVLQMIDIKDKDLNDDGMFEFFEIDDDRFPNLLRWDVDTIRVKTFLAVNPLFMSKMPNAYGIIAGSIPEMQEE